MDSKIDMSLEVKQIIQIKDKVEQIINQVDIKSKQE